MTWIVLGDAFGQLCVTPWTQGPQWVPGHCSPWELNSQGALQALCVTGGREAWDLAEGAAPTADLCGGDA